MTGPPNALSKGYAPSTSSSHKAKGGSLISRLRREYQCFEGKINSATLASTWLQMALEEDTKGHLQWGGRDVQALALRVAQCLQDVRLQASGRNGNISEDEWVHAMLLAQAPDRAVAQIYAPLRASVAKYPNMLYNLQALFERADIRGNAMLSKQDISRMYRYKSWRLHPTSTDGRPLTDLELEAPDALAEQLVSAMDVDGDGMVSYVEFVAFCVGRRKREVKLHMYDLSRGAGLQVRWLLGKELHNIWHTGIVAFEKEYFFSSDTIFDLPGETSFGTPTEVISLGHTFWSQDELHDFIVSDLKPIFHRETYDVINNNCNHFSDRLAMYLCGRHLPDEIMLQPERLMDLVSVRTARPILNWLLRDCVVSRDGSARTVEVPHGKWHRIITAEEVVPGSIVAIHPAWGRGIAMLGVVCDVQDGEEVTFGGFGGDFRAVTIGSYGCNNYTCMPQTAGSCQATSLAQATSGEVLVKYLDVSLRNWQQAGSSCSSGRVRTEKLPISRLSLATLDGDTIGADYKEALDWLTKHLVKSGLRSSFGKVSQHSALADAQDGSLPPGFLSGHDNYDTHEGPALEPLSLATADDIIPASQPEWTTDEKVEQLIST